MIPHIKCNHHFSPVSVAIDFAIICWTAIMKISSISQKPNLKVADVIRRTYRGYPNKKKRNILYINSIVVEDIMSC